MAARPVLDPDEVRLRRQRWMLAAVVASGGLWLSYRLVADVVGALHDGAGRADPWGSGAFVAVLVAPMVVIGCGAAVVRTGDLDRSGASLLMSVVSVIVLAGALLAFALLDVLLLST